MAKIDEEKNCNKVSQKDMYVIKSFDEVSEEKVEWLWYPYIPKGMLTMIAGDPGVGKTFVTTYIASVVSNGGCFPFTDTCVPKGNVLIINSEDTSSMIKNRLKLTNASLNNVYTIYNEYSLIKLSNIKLLEKFINDKSISLIIVDPLNSFIGNIDTSSDVAFRNAMSPIVKLCEQKNVTLITVTHFNKGAEKSFYRVNGSIAYMGMPRSVIFLVDGYEKEGYKIFYHQKTNTYEKGKPLSFTIVDKGINWISQMDTININDFTSGEKFTLLQEAKDYIINALENVDEKETALFKTEALEYGIAKKTFDSARSFLKKAKIIGERIDGKTKKHFWYLLSKKE